MPEQSPGEKILPASPRKKQRAREEGNVARSQDLSAAVSLTVALFAMWFLGPAMFRGLFEATAFYFGNLSWIEVDTDTFQSLAGGALRRVAGIMLPFMLIMLLAGVTINLIQVGLLLTAKTLQFKPERIDPIRGMKKFVSLRTFVELIKSIFKLTFVSVVVYYTLRDRWPGLAYLMELTPEGSIQVITAFVISVWWRVALVMIVIAILDYGYQRWQYERDLRMSRKEASDEAKELEGDPRIKQRVRQLQRQMAMQRMMAEVPEADVIITNPVRYAIALRYDENRMEAPVIVAKGARLVAERIRSIGTEHNVPIVERPVLARSLYRMAEVGDAVPENLFRAVAEVLAYVYQIDRREGKRRERQRTLSTAELPA